MASVTVEEIMNLNTEPMTHEDNITKRQTPVTLDDLVDFNDRWWDDDSDPQNFEKMVDALYYTPQSMYVE